LVQGAGGMKMFDEKIFDELLAFMKQEEIICIADEVMTGFYRTGKMFASEFMITSPDIICISKGLTGGTMALGVTACTQNIYDAFVSDEQSKTFFHGHSFTANPIACSAALASLKLFQRKKSRKKVQQIIGLHKKFVARLRQSSYHKQIKNVRETGTIVAFEVVTPDGDSYLNNIRDSFTPYCMQHGVYLRPLGNTIYIMPPYCIKKRELKKVYEVIERFLNQAG
jgi:adenosylmethionine-8-amino-7-oxononanoate aminotransferase